MNKLKTNYTGGWPLDLEDLEFSEAAIREAFYGLMSAFGIEPEDSFILSGCNQVSGNYNDGYIVLNGEILKVVGAAVPSIGVGEVLNWKLDTTYDTAGREQLENGSTVDTYELRRGKLVSSVETPGEYMPFLAPSIFEVIAEKMSDLFVVKSKVITEFQTGTGNATTSPSDIIAAFIPSTAMNCTKMKFHFSANITPSNAAPIDTFFRLKINGTTVLETSTSSASTAGGRRQHAFVWVGAYAANTPVQVEAYTNNYNSTVNDCQLLVEGIGD